MVDQLTQSRFHIISYHLILIHVFDKGYRQLDLVACSPSL